MNNQQSYTYNETVDYYHWLAQYGLFQYESAIVRKYFSQGDKILDVGCGVGRATFGLSQLGFIVSGVDYSTTMIEKAREVYPKLDFSVQNAMCLKYANNTFDGGFFSFNGLMLIESYNDRQKALIEIMRVIRENGVFFFTTPFLDNKIEGEYWKSKISSFCKPLADFSKDELMLLGNETLQEGSIEFKLHIPFTSEIKEMINKCGYKILLAERRLDFFAEEGIEDELDDNYLWVIKK